MAPIAGQDRTVTAGKVALVGPMATGKSPVGTRVAHRLWWAFHDSDRDLEDRTGAKAAQMAERQGTGAMYRHEVRVPLGIVEAAALAGPTARGSPRSA